MASVCKSGGEYVQIDIHLNLLCMFSSSVFQGFISVCLFSSVLKVAISWRKHLFAIILNIPDSTWQMAILNIITSELAVVHVQ